ncbi:MAG: stage III sporulation protein AD [Bacillota bacterium]
MDLGQILGICLVSLVFVVVLRHQRPEMAVILSVATGVMVILLLVGRIGFLYRFMADLGVKAGIDLGYLSTILRIIGIAYIAEFAAQICRDAKEEAMAAKVELAGKILILVLAVPIVGAVLEVITGLLF